MNSSSRLPGSPFALRSGRLALLVLLLGTIASAARAASRTWSTTPADSNWSNGVNWVGGNPPGPGDDLTFPASSTILATSNDLTSGINIVAITFQGAGYTLSGNAITIGEILCSNLVVGTNTLSLPMAVVNSGVVMGTGAGCTLDLEGDIGGPGGILATGGGPVILGGTNSYLGSTKAGATSGFLVVNGTGAGAGVVVMESSGDPTLRGHGTFTGPLAVDNSFPTDTATVFPGTSESTGILSTGSASFGSSGTRTILKIRLNGLTAGTDYDQLDVGGTVTFMHAFLQVSLGFVPPAGAQFTVVKNDGGNAVTGTFEGLSEGAKFLVGDMTFQITYVGGAGHDVVLTAVDSEATPQQLDVDAAGNGVLEKGETVVLAPGWKNQSGGPASLSGSVSLFTGPAVATTTFTITDGTGSYGTIADGNTASCTDCYAVEITAPNRPSQHWDTTINETTAPFSQIKTWTLHVGESFPDVPTSHPFYKFVENLFHNGVTGGCAGGNYCPSNPVTRAQMAVFLLKGEHGSSYSPPACASTMFTDVPCPSGAFVDWINQLASESITGGCGNGQYCPQSSVTRGQMAVFLLKGEHGGGYTPPACSATMFTDVPCPAAQFVNFINELATEEITGGCGNGQYCPGNSVTRGQMAVFLVKTFGLNLYGP